MPTPLTNTQRSRVLGSYYGSLAGDALGAPYEFKERDSYEVSSDYVECKTFHIPLPLGGWTDDSSMMLCLLESLLEYEGNWNADDCVRRWIRWQDQGYMSVVDECFDIGTSSFPIVQWPYRLNIYARSQAWPPRVLFGLIRRICASTRNCLMRTSWSTMYKKTCPETDR
jgi:hypothetical protein